jgi:NADPH-dependent curcumin reductase CurA
MIADYNKPFEKKYGVRGLQVFFEKRLKMQGYLVADLHEKYDQRHQEDCQKWIKDGSLKVKMSTTVGIDNAIKGLLGLFEGENFGKAVLQIAKE